MIFTLFWIIAGIFGYCLFDIVTIWFGKYLYITFVCGMVVQSPFVKGAGAHMDRYACLLGE